jgi:hypothetical protein
MINKDWLADITHKKYDTRRRIAGSGIAWGDVVDPEDEEAARQELNELGGGKRKGKTSLAPNKRAKTLEPNANSEAGPSTQGEK